MPSRVSRLAPSPTGALHLGNVRTFLLNWAMARNFNWELKMRIEDLDGPRVRPGAAQATLDTLAWLGIDHDGPVLTQSEDLAPYRSAMAALAEEELVYACDLSRREVEMAASAPHGRDGEEVAMALVTRPRDRNDYRFERQDSNYRLVVGPEPVVIDDRFAGRSVHRPSEEVGDFVVWTRRGTPSYQLAVVVDDARQGVNEVVRGEDLLPSAARQEILYRYLRLQPPHWWHLPLVVGPDGRRLAKRHGDTRIDHYRAGGVRAERVLGLMAHWCGLGPRREMSAEVFRHALGQDLDRISRQPIVLGHDDETWLRP